MRNILFAAIAFAAVSTPAAAAPTYRLSSELTLPGTSPGWDYLTYEPKRGYLFLGRRKAGVSVVDTRTNKLVTTIANSVGANIALPVAELDRGYTANGDGSTTIFQLSTLKTIARVSLGEAADAVFFDPATRQLVFTFGDSKELVFLDPKTNSVSGRLPMAAEELEGVAMVGDGTLWVNERDITKIAHVDNRTHKLIAEYDLPGCTMPTGLALDSANKRLFVGCKGDKPVLAVVDTNDGHVVQTVEIGRGNDGIAYDPATRRIFTANGIDGNIVVIDQINPDSYKFASAFTTRPIARTLAYDPATRRIYTMTAQGMVDPGKDRNLRAGSFYPNSYYDNSFSLLTYSEQ
jgi:DNA-binding beta-propeller fold protein YncE